MQIRHTRAVAVKVNIFKEFEVLGDVRFVQAVGKLILLSGILEASVSRTLRNLGKQPPGDLAAKIKKLNEVSDAHPGDGVHEELEHLEAFKATSKFRARVAHGFLFRSKAAEGWFPSSRVTSTSELITVELVEKHSTQLSQMIFAVWEIDTRLMEDERFAETPGAREYQRFLQEIRDMNQDAEDDAIREAAGLD